MATRWSVDWLKKVYLTGVSLTDDNDDPYPDELFEQGLNEALQWIQREIDVVIAPEGQQYVEIVSEPHDWTRDMAREWFYLSLLQKPVQSVTKIEFWYAGRVIFTVPTEWIIPPRTMSTKIQIMPGAGTLAPVQMMGFAAQALSRYDRLPSAVRVTYRAGYTVENMPDDIRGLAGRFAAIYPLNIAGDLLGGAGIASASTGVDGVSTSYSTTSSATNAGYGARIIQYFKEIKRILPVVARAYHGMPMRVA